MSDDGETQQADRDVVERFFAASERGDTAVVMALVHDDIIMDGRSPGNGSSAGTTSWRRWLPSR